MTRSEAKLSPTIAPTTGNKRTDSIEMTSADTATFRAPRTAMSPPISGAVNTTEKPLMPRTTPADADDPVVSSTSQGIAT